MSLYIILKKIDYGKINGNDYLFLLRDKMVTKMLICYCIYVKTNEKKHFHIIFMKNQKKNPK